MRFFTASFAIQTKQKLNKVWFPLLLILLLVASFTLVLLGRSATSPLSFKAGVAYSTHDPFGSALMERLEKMELVDFQPLANKEKDELVALVESKTYDTIYILKDNLEERIITGRINNAIPSLVSPSGSFSTFLDKWVFANAIIQASPQISLHELSQTVGLPINELEPIIQETFTWYEDNYQFVIAQPKWLEMEGVLPPSEGASPTLIRLSRGLICLILLVFAALTLDQGIGNQGQTAHRLNLKAGRMFAFGSFASLWVTNLLLGLPSLLLLNLLGLTASSLLFDILALAAFTFFLSSLVLTLSRLLISRSGLASQTIFSLLLVLVFGGIVFDPLEVSESLNKLAHFIPSYYYMNGLINYSPLYFLYLVLAGTFLFIVTLIVPVGFRKRSG